MHPSIAISFGPLLLVVDAVTAAWYVAPAPSARMRLLRYVDVGDA